MPGVKGRSGRKPKSTLRRLTQHTIAETSPYAASYLRDVAKGIIDKPDSARIDVCKYMINQDCGMPRQKSEISGVEGEPIRFIIGKGYDDNKQDTIQSDQ